MYPKLPDKMFTFIAIFSCTLILANSKVKECEKTGLMCETCTSTVMCVGMAGKFTKSDRANCPFYTTCHNGVCTPDLNPLCDYENLVFPCQYQGQYPHPGDWTKYVFCASMGSDPKGPMFTTNTVTCEPGAAYNPATFYCDKDLTKISNMVFPIEPCMAQSRVPVALPGNPSIYYMCSPYGPSNKLYPRQSTCPNGGNFSNGGCKFELV